MTIATLEVQQQALVILVSNVAKDVLGTLTFNVLARSIIKYLRLIMS
jgi:hypothetical protein